MLRFARKIPDTIWTEDLVDRLIERHAEGLSANQIATEFGVTRNTICGKVSRLELPPRKPRLNDSQRQQAKLDRLAKDRERQAKRRLNVVRKDPVMIAIAPFQGSLEIPYRDLESFKTQGPNQCRYVADEPGGPDYLACGNPTDDGKSWCRHHSAIVHSKPLTITPEDRARRSAQGWRFVNAPSIIKNSREAS